MTLQYEHNFNLILYLFQIVPRPDYFLTIIDQLHILAFQRYQN